MQLCITKQVLCILQKISSTRLRKTNREDFITFNNSGSKLRDLEFASSTTACRSLSYFLVSVNLCV